jgi:hypothetical protein
MGKTVASHIKAMLQWDKGKIGVENSEASE